MCNVASSGHMPYGGGFLTCLAKCWLDLTSSMEIKNESTRDFKWLPVCILTGFPKPQTRSLWKLIGRMQFFPLLNWANWSHLFIYLFGRRRLEAQSEIQINSCPIPRNSRSWTFTVNPPSETLHSNFSSKPCIMKIFLYAPTLKLFFSVINHSHKLVRSRLVPCFFFFFAWFCWSE